MQMLEDEPGELQPPPPLPPIVIDFECYYSKDYTLTKLNVIEYVMHPDFEVVGFSFSTDGVKRRWVTGDKETIRQALLKLQLHRRRVVAHNAFFEAAIIEWVFDIHPLEWFCTMMGARPFVQPFTGSVSLATCADHLGLPTKGAEVVEFKGKRRKDFDTDELKRYALYCSNDVSLTWGVYQYIMARMPVEEQTMLHLTVEKFVRSRLSLDRSKLEEAFKEVDIEEGKAELTLAALNLKRIDVTSNPRFAAALRNAGVTDPPVKTSPTTGKETYAFAKRDPEFIALRTHPNVVVQQLVEARLLLKSSIERTRIEQFLQLLNLTGCLPVPLMYYGAHTGRFAGMMGFNLQNLPRGSSLRQAIIAPDGYKIITVDLSAIEARITAVLAGQWDLVQAFANGEDVYSTFASAIYNYPVSDCEETADERFVGKFSILGLGYGMGVDKFDAQLQGYGRTLDPTLISRIVALYRNRYTQIPRLWRRMDACLNYMMSLPKGSQYAFPDNDAPCLTFTKGKVVLPNGMPIFYPSLHRNSENQAKYRAVGNGTQLVDKDIWGGTLTENVVQALARIVLSRAELRLASAGLRASLQVHDELVYIVPDRAVSGVVGVLKRTLSDPVPWMPRLPLACKVGVGQSYGEAK